MPSKNTIKQFDKDAYYHIYNRGVNKSVIFKDIQDYLAFLRRLQLMLLPPKDAAKLQHTDNRIRINNYYGDIQLLAFCLMPNHFHMMLGQTSKGAITEFMRTLGTSYSMYFNLKYKRVGPLYQGRFKAAHINSDSYFMHLSRYIHLNPINLTPDIYKYDYSSLKYYYNANRPEWIQSQQVEALFSSKDDYSTFVNMIDDLDKIEKVYNLD